MKTLSPAGWSHYEFRNTNLSGSLMLSGMLYFLIQSLILELFKLSSHSSLMTLFAKSIFFNRSNYKKISPFSQHHIYLHLNPFLQPLVSLFHLSAWTFLPIPSHISTCTFISPLWMSNRFLKLHF